jgi:uncharacterized membrane protein
MFEQYKKFLPHIIVGLAVLGLVDSGYLYAAHVMGTELACGILDGCNAVSASPYSSLFGIPFSLLGLIFYGIVLVIGFCLFTDWVSHAKKLFYIIAGLGALSSVCFAYIQAFLIGSWCVYCIISAVITFILLGIAIWMWRDDTEPQQMTMDL